MSKIIFNNKKFNNIYYETYKINYYNTNNGVVHDYIKKIN